MKTAHPFHLTSLAALAILSSPATAQIIVSDPNVPPAVSPVGNVGYYLTGAAHPFYNAGGVTVFFDSMLVRTLAPITRIPSGANESASFSANMDAVGDVFVPPGSTFNDVPSTATGSGAMVTFGKVGNTTGNFITELLTLNLNGTSAVGPYMIRESPTLLSPGQTAITDIGGGQYRIDSFFDVFTELSIDGGQTWAPDANGPARITLIPEPSLTFLAGLGGFMIFLPRRRG